MERPLSLANASEFRGSMSPASSGTSICPHSNFQDPIPSNRSNPRVGYIGLELREQLGLEI